MRNNELYHSYEYLGKDYSDGFKHFKYVKRVKMGNGKYKYYYTDAKGHKDIQNKANMVAQYQYRQTMATEGSRRAHESFARNAKEQNEYNKLAQKLAKEAVYNAERSSFAESTVDEYLLSNQVKSAINKGKNYLNSLLNKFK